VKKHSRESLRCSARGRADHPKPGSGITRVAMTAARSSIRGGRRTGGILITPLPGAIDQKPARHAAVLRRIPAIVDNDGKELEGACEGNLVITDSCRADAHGVRRPPAIRRHVLKTFPELLHRRRREARRDGYYWITGGSTTC